MPTKRYCKHGHERTAKTVCPDGYCRVCKENQRRAYRSGMSNEQKQVERKRLADWRASHPEAYQQQKVRGVEAARQRRKVHPKSISLIWSETKKSARTRGIEFLLTKADVTTILSQPCGYGSWVHGLRTPLGIDRKNNSMGYTVENSVPACARHNFMKSDWFTYEEMLGILQLYPNHKQCGPVRWAEKGII